MRRETRFHMPPCPTCGANRRSPCRGTTPHSKRLSQFASHGGLHLVIAYDRLFPLTGLPKRRLLARIDSETQARSQNISLVLDPQLW